MNKDLHITIAGPQGSGKSVIAERVASACERRGYRVDRKQEGVFTGGTVGVDGPRAIVEEIGDNYAALDFFIEKNMAFEFRAIENRRGEKLATFRGWHAEQAGG